MMPTPVVYQNSVIDPFAHLTETQKSTAIEVFYATNRVPEAKSEDQEYGNSIDKQIHLGVATVHMGDQGASWNDVYEYSRADKQMPPMPIKLGRTIEMAVMPTSLTTRQQK